MLKALSPQSWSFTSAAHLLNRAGFGGRPEEIEKLVSLGPQKAVSQFVDYESIPDPALGPEWAKPDPNRASWIAQARGASQEERRRMFREEQQNQRQHLLELRQWWLQRMASGPNPLQEKMALFWHGHFATSFEKVRDAYLMWRQNDLFRRHGTGKWLNLLTEVAKDPAMLVWLDQAQSRKEHPNENFAREVMELFTLGEGHYTEHDVTEAARALTGWSYDRATQQFVLRPNWHDYGTKTIFGRAGNFDGQDVLALIVAQAQAARFITAKLWNYFAGQIPNPQLAEELASTFRATGGDFKPFLRMMFLSEEFYSPAVIRCQVKSPVQWLVGSVRVLERELPPPMVSAGLMRNLGQELFAPPNVKGWDGGLSWITTNTLLARYNQAATLLQGDVSPVAENMSLKNPNATRQAVLRLKRVQAGGVDVTRLFSNDDLADNEALTHAVEKRMLQARLKPQQEKTLNDYLAQHAELDDTQVLNALRLVMCTPEYQLT